MQAFKRQLAGAIALTCFLVAASGSALAAPPETPPGQERKAEAATPAPAQQAPGRSEQAPGQEKKAEQAAPAPAPAATKTQGINATSAGVKPSNDTDKNTTCRTGGSMPSPTCARTPQGDNPPDSSKRYGNGQTAAQIATSRGAPAGTAIYGPGNSQPHKVCGKNGKWVDVHAVKSYEGLTCGSTSTRTATRHVAPSVEHTIGSHAVPTASPAGVTASSSAAPTGGGVAGAEASVSSGGPGAAGGVLGAVASFGAAGTLPFTGFPLWAVALTGLVATAVGWALLRTSRPAREIV